MKVRVLLFGPQADAAGRREVVISLGADRSCRAVMGELGAACPALAGSLASSRLAVNHEFAEESRLVTEGDEVALIGMVAGG